MYWKTPNQNYIALVATDSFSCWGKINLKGYGKLDRSSSFLKFDNQGLLLSILDGPVSTSDEDDFYITDIYFVANLELIKARFINHDMQTEESKFEVLISQLTKCNESELPTNMLNEVLLFKTDPQTYKTYKRRATLVSGND